MGESPEAAARRETEEEIAGLVLPDNQTTVIDVQDCGAGWRFYIIGVDVERAFDVRCRDETDAIGWFNLSEMWSLHLHSGFQRWVDIKSRF